MRFVHKNMKHYKSLLRNKSKIQQMNRRLWKKKQSDNTPSLFHEIEARLI